MNFIIKTHFSGVVYQKPCLFVLNKGLNSGKPQFEPFTNSFVIIFEKQEDRENLYYVAYSLWRSKYWLQHLVGSVIPFLRIKDFKHEFSAKAKMMMEEHENEGERFRKIAELSNNYTPPADGCNTYQVTFAMLNDFEKDLHLHIHLENNILFPAAIKLEQQFG